MYCLFLLNLVSYTILILLFPTLLNFMAPFTIIRRISGNGMLLNRFLQQAKERENSKSKERWYTHTHTQPSKRFMMKRLQVFSNDETVISKGKISKRTWWQNTVHEEIKTIFNLERMRVNNIVSALFFILFLHPSHLVLCKRNLWLFHWCVSRFCILCKYFTYHFGQLNWAS